MQGQHTIRTQLCRRATIAITCYRIQIIQLDFGFNQPLGNATDQIRDVSQIMFDRVSLRFGLANYNGGRGLNLSPGHCYPWPALTWSFN